MAETNGYNVAALDERVTGLERSVATIAQSLDGLAKEIRERQRFPWAVVLSGVSVMLFIFSMLGGIVLWSFNGYLSGNSDALDRLQSQMLISVPRTEYEERKLATDERTDRIESELQRLSDSIVPRGEHAGHWQAQATDTANLQRQIDEVRSVFGSTYSLGDAIATLQERIDRLEQLRLQQSVDRAQ